MDKPKLADVAKRAGVSLTTVSRVLNNRGYIGDKTREKVHVAMKELNYYPNEIARSLFIRKTYIVGVIFPTTNNPFYGQLIYHLENFCEALGYKVLLCNSGGREDKERAYLEMLQRHQVDGIIAGAHNRGIDIYQRSTMPIVGVDRYLAGHIPIVSSDNYRGGVMATEHLIDRGCKHILHINGQLSLETPANLRRNAYEETMKRKKMPYKTYETVDDYISRMFDENPKIDGVFASDDLIAACVIREANKRGMNVPEDLKVIGYDGADMTRMLLPELTTIKQPIKDMAEEAVHLLMNQINEVEEPTVDNITLPVQLIQGKTT
ncbi:LacI family DNA-binding transcriptional regulator [Amphibacillus jilinensis]|uniref:LacI family DNA-binding transcriptional regulator n=1 Tax=Amphibacillus jilinensis TaxID=1216008 RepID=UPI0002DB9CED|nr:LacI family DNA-binding transcriptional regulator [Amphibacillus jilinensis]